MPKAPDPPSGTTAGYGSSTVDKALDVLTVVAESPDGLTNPQISETLTLDRSTAHRLVTTLERRGLLRRLPDRRFTIGPQAMFLALGGTPDPRLAINPVLHDLVELTGESASVSVRHGDRFHCVAHQVSPHELSYCPVTGTSYPLNSGAAGLALWAFLPQTERDRLLDTADLRAFTETTITARTALRAELDQTERRGYAVSSGARTPGGCSVAVPVHGRQGFVVGALALSAAEARLPLDELVEYEPNLHAAAASLASQLGAAPSIQAQPIP